MPTNMSDNIPAQIRRLLAPPVFEDEEKSRIASLLYLMALTLLLVSVVAAIGAAVFGHLDAARALPVGAIGQLVALWLARRGHLDAARLLVPTLFLAVLDYTLFKANGFPDVVMLVYPVVLVVAAMLLDRRTFAIYGLLATLSLQAIIYAELKGWIGDEFSQFTTLSDLVYVSVIMLVTAVSARLMSESITRNITKERLSRHALARNNRKLLRINGELTREIADRQRAEAALRESEQQLLHLRYLLQNITNSMPSALIALDAEGRVLTWNPAAEELTSKTTTQMEGKSLWGASPELACYRDLFDQVLHDRQVVQRHREPVGERFPALSYRDVSVFPLVGDGIEGAVLRIDDVTRRVQLEEMMLQSAKMASVGGLAAGVAHEINNPLGAVMQGAQMLQLAFDTRRPRTCEWLGACGVDPAGLDSYLQERGLAEYMEGIREAGGRAAKIVSDLLTFSRKTSSDTAPRDLNELVEQTLDLAATDYNLKKGYDFRNIEIVREMAPSLPQVICDGQQIQQVVLNLVRNAAQAMAKRKIRTANCDLHGANGEWRPRLTLRTSLIPNPQSLIPDPQSLVRLEVEDNGPGIPEAAREWLFEPFYTTKEVGEGTGLGLWLCWSIVVERHKGRIWTEPVSEGGTRLVVELPAV